MSLLLGIDLGTSYFKVGLFDKAGALRGLGRIRVEKEVPAPGWCELAVDEFWRTLRAGLREALTEARAELRDIAGISYSSQANTIVLLDERDALLTPLVIWTDTRGDPVPGTFAAFADSEAFRRTIGFAGISGQFAVAKLHWFKRERAALWQRVRSVMTISDYFTFALTGERVGDASTAAFLGLYDLTGRQWWPEALATFGIAASQLSRPLPPGSPVGRTGARAADLLGVPAGVPFAVGAIDHHAAAIGSGLERLADVSISTGTVLAALRLVDAVEPAEGSYHGPHIDGRRFYRLAFDANGAGQLEEFQRTQAAEFTIEQLLDLAAAPHPTGHGAAVRGLLERISARQRELVLHVSGAHAAQRVVATGGAARSPRWLQITADVLRMPVITSACPERACLGAALFAAVAAGMHASVAEAAATLIHADRIYEPRTG